MDTVKAFISYSWTSPEHENWVLELATKLRSNGVDITLDKWDLKEGQDKYSFMEKMVTDPEIKKVLLICDSSYQRKANDRKGGVGTESQIISSELYEKVNQTKFIPIVVEYENRKPCLPAFLSSRMYIDLTDDSDTDEYEKLLRAIYEKPLHKKPSLGSTPTFLNDNSVEISTTGIFELLKSSIKSAKPNIKSLYIDFLELLKLELDKNHFLSLDGEVPDDEIIYQNIEYFKPYYEQFVTIHYELTKNDLIYTDELTEFFEFCLARYHLPKSFLGGSFKTYSFDNIKFVTRELFLTLLTILKKFKKFQEFNELIDHVYYVDSSHEGGNKSCFEICAQHQSLDKLRKERLQLSRTSITADMLKERFSVPGIDFNSLIETDYILWFRGMQKNLYWWVPVTMVFLNSYSPSMELFTRGESKKYFKTLCQLLNVESKIELEEQISSWREAGILNGWRLGNNRPLPVISILNIEKLDTV